jgi:hypothetical protein
LYLQVIKLYGYGSNFQVAIAVWKEFILFLDEQLKYLIEDLKSFIAGV